MDTSNQRDRFRQARRVRRACGRRPLGRLRRRDGEPRPPARSLQGDGRSRPAQLARTCEPRRLRRTLCARMAQLTGRRRLRRLPRHQRHLRADAGAGRSCSPTRTAPSSSRMPGPFRPRCGPTRTRRWRLSAPARAFAWGDHDGRLYCGVAAFYRNAYRGSLVPNGCRRSTASSRSSRPARCVADIGCGHGHSTVLMAEAFPASKFRGFDTHPESVAEARQGRRRGRRRRRATFAAARADDYPRHGLRPDLLLRLPARHGRSGRRGDACRRARSHPTAM